jgi:hypothetical protein
MIARDQKRKRAKPHFASELPLEVKRLESDDPRFDDLIQATFGKLKLDIIAVRSQLINIASDLMNSRRMQQQKPSRSDSNRTLFSLSNRLERLSDCIDNLGLDEAAALEKNLDRCCFQNPEPGISALNAMIDILRSLEDAAHCVLRSKLSQGNLSVTAISLIEDETKIAALELEGLSLDTEWALVTMQQYLPLFRKPPKNGSRLATSISLIEKLAKLSEAAHAIETKQRGPRQDIAQSRAVSQLLSFYEQVSGKRATHSAVQKDQYCGTTQSAFGKFVVGFMVIADPDPRNRRGIHEAISYVVWPGRSGSKAGDVEAAREKREQQILDYLAS